MFIVLRKVPRFYYHKCNKDTIIYSKKINKLKYIKYKTTHIIENKKIHQEIDKKYIFLYKKKKKMGKLKIEYDVFLVNIILNV